MLITLFKKQVSELLSGMLGGKPVKQGIFSVRMMIYLLLGFYLFIIMFRVFWSMAYSLCEPLCSIGNDWMYFALMGVMATFIGVTGSLFTANSTIYQARDNEFLLSMPIPQWMIVFVRMAMIYIVSAAFEIMVMFPTCLMYWAVAAPPIQSLVFQIAGILLLPVLAVTIACLIGWISAVVNSRIHKHAIFSVVTSLAFIAVFYYVYWNLYTYLGLIVSNAETLGGVMKYALYPFYQFGSACSGNIFAFVIFAVLMTAIMVLTVKLIAGNFVELAAKSQVVARRKTKKKDKKEDSPTTALFKKELQRFTSSSVSMLSCALGSIMMVVIGVMCIFAGEWVVTTFMGMSNGVTGMFPLIALLIVTMMTSMNTITATSISLEGKHLWMLKVLPVSPWQVFKAKLAVHLIMTGIPAMFCAMAFGYAGNVTVGELLMMMLASIVFTFFTGLLGLTCNLRFPNLTWTNEAQAVKQNMSVITATFIPWGVLILLAVVCTIQYMLGETAMRCILTAIALIGGISFLMVGKLQKSGTERFMDL